VAPTCVVGTSRCDIPTEPAWQFVLGDTGETRLAVRVAQFKEPFMQTFAQSLYRKCSTLALMACVVMTARAQDFEGDSPIPEPISQTTRFGISPFYGYRFGGEVEDPTTGSTYSFQDSEAYGLFVDYAPLNHFGRYELLWSHQDSSLDFKGNSGLGKVDLTVDVVQVGGVAEFGTESFRQYVSMHIGATHYATDDYGNDTRFSLGIGGGLKLYVTKNIYLRGDIRGFCTITDAEGSFIYVNGITVATFSASTLWQGQASVGVGITF